MDSGRKYIISGGYAALTHANPCPLPPSEMRLTNNPGDCTALRQRLPRRVSFPADFHLPQRQSSKSASKPRDNSPESIYEAWLKSREMPNQKGAYLVPGAPRPLTLQNARLAFQASQMCIFDLVSQHSLSLRFHVLNAAVSLGRYGGCTRSARRRWCRSMSSGVSSPPSEVIPRCVQSLLS
jgi:hypothetical protein